MPVLGPESAGIWGVQKNKSLIHPMKRPRIHFDSPRKVHPSLTWKKKRVGGGKNGSLCKEEENLF